MIRRTDWVCFVLGSVSDFCYRRLSAEQSRYREICDSVNAQVALVSSSFSSKLGLSSSSTTAPISASEDDWLATVQHKLKAFESQAAAVSQARNA